MRSVSAPGSSLGPCSPAVGGETWTPDRLLDWLVTLEGPGPRTLLVVAHPDDETVGAGATLARLDGCRILHVTDGAPRQFGLGEAHAQQRRAEVLRALTIAGIGADRLLSCLGGTDQEAAHQMVRLAAKLVPLLVDDPPDLILTHPFEGGHPDHDATSFIVRAAGETLRRAGSAAPVVIEMTFYWLRDGRLVPHEFLPADGTRVVTRKLSEQEREGKARMFVCFETQQHVLREFLPIEVERFRLAPAYDFCRRPHEGQLHYEKHGWMSFDTWCRLASFALHELAGPSCPCGSRA